jgi:hypothetical protein
VVYSLGKAAGVIEHVLAELISRHARLLDSESGWDDPRFNKIGMLFPPATVEALAAQFMEHRDRGDFAFQRHGYIHLEPAHEGRLYPVLTFAYDWTREVLRLRVALFTLFEDEEQEKLRAFGYRFETPECRDDDGTPAQHPGATMPGHHDFFHVQPIRHMHRSLPNTELPTVAWLNETQPSVPIAANDLPGLLLGTLISVYGGREVRERQQRQELKPLRNAAKAIPWLSGEGG